MRFIRTIIAACLLAFTIGWTAAWAVTTNQVAYMRPIEVQTCLDAERGDALQCAIATENEVSAAARSAMIRLATQASKDPGNKDAALKAYTARRLLDAREPTCGSADTETAAYCRIDRLKGVVRLLYPDKW